LLIRLLHLADLHLGWRPSFAVGPDAAELVARHDGVLAQAAGYALDPANSIAGLLIAGDLFDAHSPSATLVETVIGTLERLVSRGLFVITVPGNHDELTYVDSVYRKYQGRWPGYLVTSPDCRLAASVTVDGLDIHLYGLTYLGGVTQPGSLVTDFAHSRAAGLHLAVLHGTVAGKSGLPPGWARDERSLPVDAARLAAAGYDYVALGHIHRPGPPAGWDNLWPPCRYAGAASGRGFDDPGCGFVTVVELQPETGGRARVGVREHPVDVTPYHRVALDLSAVHADSGGLLEAVRAAAQGCRPGALRIELTGVASMPPDAEALAALAKAAAGHLHVEVLDQSSVLDPEALAACAREATVRGFFARSLLAKLGEPEQDRGQGTDRQLLELAWRYGSAALGGSRRSR